MVNDNQVQRAMEREGHPVLLPHLVVPRNSPPTSPPQVGNRIGAENILIGPSVAICRPGLPAGQHSGVDREIDFSSGWAAGADRETECTHMF